MNINSISETNFKVKVQKFLDSKNIYHRKIFVGQFGRAGTPDIFACVNGKFVAIELKREKGKPSNLQLVNLKQIQDNGGIGILLHPSEFEDFKAYINELLGESNE